MADPIKFSLESPVADGVRQMLLGQLGEIQDQSRLVLETSLAVSVEAVHDLRVLLRKNMTVFAAFAPWLDQDWLKNARKGYARLLKRLGKLRDLDVLHAWLSQEAGDLAWLLEIVDRERAVLRQKLQEKLDGKPFVKWMDRQVAALSQPDPELLVNPRPVIARGGIEIFRLQDCLPAVLYLAAANLTACGDRMPDNVLHRLRIAAKSFRYTLEVSQSLLGRPAKQLINDFKSFQDLLGQWHDATVALKFLEQLPAEQKKSARLAKLHAGLISKMEALRNDFEVRWPLMSPAWFHQRISACLDVAFGLKNRPESQG